MGVTISTHNGSSVARDHNIRNRKVTDKEAHIDPNGVYEIWHDERLVDAYQRIFGDAVERYNAKQRRADRRIENYLAAIRGDAKKKEVYEMIIGVYGTDCTDQTKQEILRQFVDGWKERNPNLELVGAYYHADEEGKDPHVHIDYIPVAHGYKKGMDTQNGLVKALEEQGIEGGETTKETAQIRWERRENAYLEQLCADRGLTVEHTGKGKKHLDTAEYKELQDALAAMETELAVAQEQLTGYEEAVDSIRDTCDELDRKALELRVEIEEAENRVDALTHEKTQREGILSDLREVCADVDACSVKRTPVPLRAGKSIVDNAELDRVEEQAKAYAAFRDERAALENERSRLKKLDTELFYRERAVGRRETAANQKELDLAERETAVAQREKAQAGLQDNYNKLDGSYTALSNLWQTEHDHLVRVRQILYNVKEAIKKMLRGLHGVLTQDQQRYMECIIDEIGNNAKGDLQFVLDYPNPIGDRYKEKLKQEAEAAESARIRAEMQKNRSRRKDDEKEKNQQEHERE